MANQLGIVHPNLLTRLTPSFFPSLCTVQSDGATRSASGAAVAPAWANVTGLVDIPCRMAPSTQTDQEVLAQAGIYTEHLSVVALAGYYPTITEVMQVVVDDTARGIEYVRHDSQALATYLYVRTVS